MDYPMIPGGLPNLIEITTRGTRSWRLAQINRHPVVQLIEKGQEANMRICQSALDMPQLPEQS